MRSIVAFGLFFILSTQWAYSQERVLPLEYNPLKGHTSVESRSTSQSREAPLTLPFREDFSYPGPYPDPQLWADSFAFVNNSFAVHSKTIGVATFDALDQWGAFYPIAAASPYQFVADYLTSNPIRLDSVFSPLEAALKPEHAVLLTFYYQPQGLGGAPTPKDSLVVEFLHTPGHFDLDDLGQEQWVEDFWLGVWSAKGENLADFANGMQPFFKRVAIPIVDEAYFRKDFRFRFKNYSHIPSEKNPVNYAGNNFIWNIDYITLDRGRNITQTSYYDIAFAGPAQSMLSQYTSMPWAHYIGNPQKHLKDRFALKITNLGNITYNYSYQYVIKDESDNNVRTYSGSTWNIAPFSQDGYQSYTPHANPLVLPSPLPTAPAARRNFRIVHSIREGSQGDNFTRNDTIEYRQIFDDYFAYDDGVPEAAYGLYGAPAKAAYRFVASHPDTLKAVRFFFNRTSGDQNVKPFYLTVWNNLDPQEIIYQSEVLTPEFQQGLNQFTTYELDHDVAVGETFYVGWQQSGNNTFLSVGFDMNNDASEHTFINYNGQWEQSIMKGAMMIRPVMGTPAATGIKMPDQQAGFELYPNPAKDNLLNIRLDQTLTSGQQAMMVEIVDIHGRIVFSGLFNNTIDIAALRNGLYFLMIKNPNTGHSHSRKFIIAR